jgi:hypothetical protein
MGSSGARIRTQFPATFAAEAVAALNARFPCLAAQKGDLRAQLRPPNPIMPALAKSSNVTQGSTCAR